MKIDEGYIHLAVREFLKGKGWKLVAGQLPGGSDDECYTLNVTDPVFACDNSPDHRRRSDNKLVPDLLALNGSDLLIVEMKPYYSVDDELKLLTLLSDRRSDLMLAMRKFGTDRGILELCDPEALNLIPALGFRASTSFSRMPQFAYFLVTSSDRVEMLLPRETQTGSEECL